MNIEERLSALNIVIPRMPIVRASCLPYVIHEDLVYVSGQIAFSEGRLLHPGIVPDTVTIEDAGTSARQCVLNVLALLKDACSGHLNRLNRCIRLDGFVRSANGFHEQAGVMDCASNLLIDILGEQGRHARTAIGVNTLPLGASVEITGIFAIRNSKTLSSLVSRHP